MMYIYLHARCWTVTEPSWKTMVKMLLAVVSRTWPDQLASGKCKSAAAIGFWSPKSRKWLQTYKTCSSSSSSCGVNSNCVQFVWICGRNAHYERRKFYCLKRTTGHSVPTCFVFVVFPFLFCFVPPTTYSCWKLAAGKQTPDGGANAATKAA